MAYTSQTVADAAYEVLRLRNPRLGPTAVPRLVRLVPSALELIALRIKESDGYEGMQQDFTATPTAGRLDLSAVVGLLFDVDKANVRIAASGVNIQIIDSVETLEHGRLPTDRVWVAQDGQELVFRSTAGLLTDYATQVKIKSNYVPSLVGADSRPLLARFEGLLLKTLVELGAREPLSVMEAKESAAVGRA